MTLTVGITGVTGKFARRVVSHLLKHPDVTIRGYCRYPSKAPESISTSEKVTLFKGDAFDKEAIHTFVQGCNVLICCYLGDNKLMICGQKILINSCDELGVPRYIASDWALDYTKPGSSTITGSTDRPLSDRSLIMIGIPRLSLSVGRSI